MPSRLVRRLGHFPFTRDQRVVPVAFGVQPAQALQRPTSSGGSATREQQAQAFFERASASSLANGLK